MPCERIEKPAGGFDVAPNLENYAAARADFSWGAARRELEGLPGGAINIAHVAVDRHVAGGNGERLALRWLGSSIIPRQVLLRQASIPTASARVRSRAISLTTFRANALGRNFLKSPSACGAAIITRSSKRPECS